MQHSFFEGTEKKVELVVSTESPDLRTLGEARWREIVEACGATVLSRMRTERCDAYLLSESSLFVFEHKVLMITCGRTRLVDAVTELLKDVPASDLGLLVFERKNEVFPHRQPTSFYEDARALGEAIPGTALRFGNEYEHHLHLFHHGQAPEGDDDITLEVLMYDLDRDSARLFEQDGSVERRLEAMQRVFAGCRIEDHLFEPSGYSLNAVNGEHYGTVHVTPQEHGSYASFEKTLPSGSDASAVCASVLEIFKPRVFDVILFDRGGSEFVAPAGYILRTRVVETLDCGYRVRFLSHSLPPGEDRPFAIPIRSTANHRGPQ